MEIFNSDNHRANVILSLFFIEQSDMSYDVEEIHSLDKLQEKIDIKVVLKRTIEAHNEGVLCHLHCVFFLLLHEQD